MRADVRRSLFPCFTFTFFSGWRVRVYRFVCQLSLKISFQWYCFLLFFLAALLDGFNQLVCCSSDRYRENWQCREIVLLFVLYYKRYTWTKITLRFFSLSFGANTNTEINASTIFSLYLCWLFQIRCANNGIVSYLNKWRISETSWQRKPWNKCNSLSFSRRLRWWERAARLERNILILWFGVVEFHVCRYMPDWLTDW